MTPGAPALADLRWPSVSSRPALLVPLGSTEQRGRHLPTGATAAEGGTLMDAVVTRVVAAGQAEAS